MTTDAKEITYKSISLWNVLNLILFAAILIFLLGFFALRALHNQLWELSVDSFKDGLRIRSASDGPFVITHLYSSSGTGPIVAAFDPPIAIIDSSGRYFTKEEIDKMEWLDMHGEKTNPPFTAADIKVLYYIPQKTKPPSK